MSKEKTIHLKPEWKAYFWLLVWGVILIPFFGIGLILIWYAHKKRSGCHYEIHDRFIKGESGNISQKIDLCDIENVEVSQRWIDKKLDTGTIELSANASSLVLIGLDEPHQLAGMIRHASRAERKRLETQKKTETKSPDYDPGSLPKMDYLTGLWQQGLISDEDFKQERKHFED